MTWFSAKMPVFTAGFAEGLTTGAGKSSLGAGVGPASVFGGSIFRGSTPATLIEGGLSLATSTGSSRLIFTSRLNFRGWSGARGKFRFGGGGAGRGAISCTRKSASGGTLVLLTPSGIAAIDANKATWTTRLVAQRFHGVPGASIVRNNNAAR